MSLYNTACKNRYLKQKFMEKYGEIFKKIVTQTGEYCMKHNIKSLVLGLSGGLDSTVCAAIGKAVYDRYYVKLIGISLPCKTNSDTENSIARTTGEAFCNEYKCINIDTLYGASKYLCDTYEGESTHVSQGNLKARIRMMMLYNAASINNGIVIDTDNLSEHYLGFWTLHGDVGDFKPIGKLWKTEVYELAKYLSEMYSAIIDKYYEDDRYTYAVLAKNALDQAIKITPTDGNGVAAGGDMAQIAPGYTYNEVDKVLQYLTSNRDKTEHGWEEIANKCFNGDMEMVDHICQRYYKSAFKRNTDYVGVVL
jgi:NAD+ synthetase